MSILNFDITQAKLTDLGPIVGGEVSFHESIKVAIKDGFEKGKSYKGISYTEGIADDIPNSKAGAVLIDSGASITCIDSKIAKMIGLPIIGYGNIISPAGNSEQHPIYPARIDVFGYSTKSKSKKEQRITFHVSQIMGAKLEDHGIIALLGRDVLQHCILIYNGLMGSFSLSVK